MQTLKPDLTLTTSQQATTKETWFVGDVQRAIPSKPITTSRNKIAHQRTFLQHIAVEHLWA
jgi:hypothetical protein